MFSQNNEDQIISDYFGNHVGTFLDIGANDAVTFSNTRRLALNGWKGVLIEPVPKAYKMAVENCLGLNVHCFNFAIADKAGKMDIYVNESHLDIGDYGLLSTLKESEMDRWPDEIFVKRQVKAMRWADFYGSISIFKYDFISIDAEGMDYEILQQLDLKELETKMICVEWNSIAEMKEKFDDYILPYGFKLVHENAENLIYAV